MIVTKSRKVFAVVMALVMTMSMMFATTANGFAATNVTATNDAMYHNFANVVENGGATSYTDKAGNPITSFTVKASQAGSYWQPIGFNSEQDAKDVVWTSTDTSIATVPSHGTAVASVSGTAGTYDSQATITLVGNQAGSCSIQASFDGGSVNFTVVLEKDSNAVDGIRVIVEDYDGFAMFDDQAGLEVSKAGATSEFYNKAQAAQSFATAGTALEKFTATMKYTLGVGFEGSYIESINGVGPDSTYVNGWNYCVIRKNDKGKWAIASDSLVIGAAEYKLQPGDIVYWVYAPYADVAQYNEAKVIELNS